MALRILLADDHVMVREGLRALLEKDRIPVVGEASDGKEAVRLAERLQPDAAILDYVMPGMNGVEAALGIREVSPKTKAILLTMRTENPYLLQALKAGFRGCVLKSHAASDLIQAVRLVCKEDEIYMSPGVSRAVLDAYLSKSDIPLDPLSPRERQVLQLIAEGRSTKEVAGVLVISVKTAESHRARIMEKLSIRETAGLVRYAIRVGMLSP